MPKSLYFVAIIPPSPVYDQLQEKRFYFKEHFGSSHALKSPPHITLLAPFSISTERESEMIKVLEKKGRSYHPFEIELLNYSAFSTKVLYVDVVKNAALNDFQKLLEEEARNNQELFNYTYEPRPFRPHATLAFRDLTEQNFKKAWKEFKHEEFQATFKTNGFSLLKHNGKSWDVIEHIPF